MGAAKGRLANTTHGKVTFTCGGTMAVIEILPGPRRYARNHTFVRKPATSQKPPDSLVMQMLETQNDSRHQLLY